MAKEKTKTITTAELAQVLRAIPKRLMTKELRTQLVCALVGHSKIITMCFGYMNCSRCGEQVGDTLGGASSAKGYVVVGHACKECKATYKQLSWQDKLYAADPFPKKKPERKAKGKVLLSVR